LNNRSFIKEAEKPQLATGLCVSSFDFWEIQSPTTTMINNLVGVWKMDGYQNHKLGTIEVGPL